MDGPLYSFTHWDKGTERANGLWRMCFRFRKGDTYDVEIVDYIILNISLSEAIDLLSLFGLQSPISYDDYFQELEPTSLPPVHQKYLRAI